MQEHAILCIETFIFLSIFCWNIEIKLICKLNLCIFCLNCYANLIYHQHLFLCIKNDKMCNLRWDCRLFQPCQSPDNSKPSCISAPRAAKPNERMFSHAILVFLVWLVSQVDLRSQSCLRPAQAIFSLSSIGWDGWAQTRAMLGTPIIISFNTIKMGFMVYMIRGMKPGIRVNYCL